MVDVKRGLLPPASTIDFALYLSFFPHADRARVTRAVNAAIAVAAEPYRANARVLDMSALFTPGFRYRDAMDVDGRDRLGCWIPPPRAP